MTSCHRPNHEYPASPGPSRTGPGRCSTCAGVPRRAPRCVDVRNPEEEPRSQAVTARLQGKGGSTQARTPYVRRGARPTAWSHGATARSGRDLGSDGRRRRGWRGGETMTELIWNRHQTPVPSPASRGELQLFFFLRPSAFSPASVLRDVICHSPSKLFPGSIGESHVTGQLGYLFGTTKAHVGLRWPYRARPRRCWQAPGSGPRSPGASQHKRTAGRLAGSPDAFYQAITHQVPKLYIGS